MMPALKPQAIVSPSLRDAEEQDGVRPRIELRCGAEFDIVDLPAVCDMVQGLNATAPTSTRPSRLLTGFPAKSNFG